MHAILLLILTAATSDQPDAVCVSYGRGFSDYTVKVAADDGHATAVLIGDHWALTAAHVVEGKKSVVVDGLAAGKVYIYDEFRQEPNGLHDIALVQTDGKHGRKFYPPLSDGREQAGSLVSLAGYGAHGSIHTGFTAFDGRLRAGTQRLDAVSETTLVCSLRPGSSPIEYGIAPCDSGGPLFFDGKLAGVHSTIECVGRLAPSSKTGERSYHPRVSYYRKWIEKTIASHSVARQQPGTVDYK